MMQELASKIAPEFGIEVVAVQTYKQDDADLSVQIGVVQAASGEAIIKMGQDSIIYQTYWYDKAMWMILDTK